MSRRGWRDEVCTGVTLIALNDAGMTLPGQSESSPRRKIFSDCGYFSVKILGLKAKETRNWREVKNKYLQTVSWTQTTTKDNLIHLRFPSGFHSFGGLTQYLLAFIVLLWVKYFKSFSQEMAHSSRCSFVDMLARAYFFLFFPNISIRLRSGLCYNHFSASTLVCLSRFTTA